MLTSYLFIVTGRSLFVATETPFVISITLKTLAAPEKTTK
jgi:hypothetical protein